MKKIHLQLMLTMSAAIIFTSAVLSLYFIGAQSSDTYRDLEKKGIFLAEKLSVLNLASIYSESKNSEIEFIEAINAAAADQDVEYLVVYDQYLNPVASTPVKNAGILEILKQPADSGATDNLIGRKILKTGQNERVIDITVNSIHRNFFDADGRHLPQNEIDAQEPQSSGFIRVGISLKKADFEKKMFAGKAVCMTLLVLLFSNIIFFILIRKIIKLK